MDDYNKASLIVIAGIFLIAFVVASWHISNGRIAGAVGNLTTALGGTVAVLRLRRKKLRADAW